MGIVFAAFAAMANAMQLNLDDVDQGGLDDDEVKITLISSAGDDEKHPMPIQKFEMDKGPKDFPFGPDDNPGENNYYTHSRLVSNILEGDAEAKEIQVKQVDGETLKKIVDYLKAHKGIPHKEIQKPLRSVKVQGKDSFII